MSKPADSTGYTPDFETVRAAENEWLAQRRKAADLTPSDGDVVGLAFSGGGIRSAIFNLGVLQGLEGGGMLPAAATSHPATTGCAPSSRPCPRVSAYFLLRSPTAVAACSTGCVVTANS
jgi:predicted acylesterase/phospholipase RssA